MTNGARETGFQIRSPLFVFGQIFRGTGKIRKTCLFQNTSARDLELAVNYDFKEHSWLQIASPPKAEVGPPGASTEPNPSANGDLLRLKPGDSRIEVRIDTDSSNFPYDRFSGRIHFEDVKEECHARFLEINIESIDDLRDFSGYAAIDLGTSNSTLSLYHCQRDAVTRTPWSPDLEKTGAEVPTAVFIRSYPRFRRSGDGSCAFGHGALRESRAQLGIAPQSLQLGAKRLVGGASVLVADPEGSGGFVAPEDILYMFARHLRESAQNHSDVKARLKRLSVTFPPTWDFHQVQCWKKVFRKLGFRDEELDLSLDEASAAALFHIYRWVRDEDSRQRLIQDLYPSERELDGHERQGHAYELNLLCFDFGGGTIDLAYTRVELQIFSDVIRIKLSLQASDSMNYGGDQVTLAVFRILKRRLALARADLSRYLGEESTEPGSPSAPGLSGSTLDRDDGLFLLPTRRALHGPLAEEDETGEAKELIQEHWREVEGNITTALLDPRLEDAIDRLFPTQFLSVPEEPLDISAKRNFDWLWDCAESLKCQLFNEANRELDGVRISEDETERLSGGLPFAVIPDGIAGHELRMESGASARAALTIREIYEACSEPIRDAVLRARALVGPDKIDRVVLAGQSSRVPLVRRLFMSARSEGGFGLPPEKIEFDDENAKQAVSKGACILKVLRETLVGFEVDVADFKASLLARLFYVSPLGGEVVLFDSGAIEDLRCHEERPDAGSFASHLSIFHGNRETLLGHFEFGLGGQPLADPSQRLRKIAQSIGVDPHDLTREEVLAWRESDTGRYQDVLADVLSWPEVERVAWLERDARPGTPAQPVYRYYLSRNRNLLAVRDCGQDDQGRPSKLLYRLHLNESSRVTIPDDENPFSGRH